MDLFPSGARLLVTLFRDTKTELGSVHDLTYSEFLSCHKLFPDYELFSAATFAGEHRKNEKTESVHALVLDFDGKKFNPAHAKNGNLLNGIPPTVADFLRRFPYACLWHYTKSHSDRYPSFRVLVPLEASLSRAGYHDLTQAVLGREQSLTEVTSLDASGFPSAHIWFTPEPGQEWRMVDGPMLTETEWRSWPTPQLKTPAPVVSNGSFDPVASSFKSPVCNLNRAAAYVLAMPSAISGSGGHLATFNVARKCRDLGLSQEEIFETLRDCYNPRCEPKWSDHELRHKAREAFKAELRPVADKPPPLPPDRPTAGNTTSPAAENNQSEVTSITSGDNSNPNGGSGPDGTDWPIPEPVTSSRELPPFPLDALPDALRSWVEEQSEWTQTPNDLAAMIALSCLASCAPVGMKAQIRPGYCEPLVIWTTTGLGSGEGKSPVFSAAMAPLIAMLAPKIEQAKAKRSKELAKLKLMQGRLAALEKAAAKDWQSENKEYYALVEAVDDALEDLTAIPRFFTSDATIEALGRLLQENGGRIAILSDEGGIFDLLLGLYSDGASNLNTILSGHSGTPFQIDRKVGDPIAIKAPRLNIGLTVQPSVIRGLAGKSKFRGVGFLARFFFALPKSRLGTRKKDPTPMSAATLKGYADLFGRVQAADVITPQPGVIVFDDQAAEAVADFRQSLEKRLGLYGDLNSMTDWAGKLSGNLARVAALYALMGGSSGVSVNCVLKAQLLAPYLIQHAKAAFEMMEVSGHVMGAEVLLKWLQNNQIKSFSKRDAYRKTTLNTGDATSALETLEDLGHIRLRPVIVEKNPDGTMKQGRRPSPVYEVNPITLGKQLPHTPELDDTKEPDNEN